MTFKLPYDFSCQMKTPLSCCLLSHKSHDLSQAETRINVVASWTNNFPFLKIIRFEKKIIILSGSRCHFLNYLVYNKIFFCLRLKKITWYTQQPTTNTDGEHLLITVKAYLSATFSPNISDFFSSLGVCSLWIELIRNYVVFTSIQSAVHVFEIKEEGMAAIPPMLTPNEIWAASGVPPSAIIVASMVGL